MNRRVVARSAGSFRTGPGTQDTARRAVGRMQLSNRDEPSARARPRHPERRLLRFIAAAFALIGRHCWSAFTASTHSGARAATLADSSSLP